MAIFKVLKTKPERNRINLLSHQNVSIYLGFRGNKTELLGTISNFSKICLEHFCLFQATQEQNKTFLFLKNGIKTKPKRFKLRQGFLKTEQNF